MRISNGLPCLLALFLLCLFFASPSTAGDLRIVVEARPGGAGKPSGPVMRYDLSFCGKDGAAVCYEFSRQGRVAVRVEGSADGSWTVVRFGPGGRREELMLEGPVVLSDGYPVPYDLARPASVPESFDLLESRAVESLPAVQSRYEATVESRSAGEALQNGWITADQAEAFSDRPLRVVRIRRSSEPVLLQVWADGIPWWIYQETPYATARLTEGAE